MTNTINRLKLLLSFALVVMGVSMNAQIETNKDYYIQNVESGLFLCGANSWGTRASLSVQGDVFRLTLSDGLYAIENTVIGSTINTLGYNLFVDTRDGNIWNISRVSSESGVYSIYASGTEFDGYLSQSSEPGSVIGYLTGSSETLSQSAKWRFLTREEAIEQLMAAEKGRGVSASFLIANPNFSRSHDTSKWIVSENCKNKTLSGGSVENMCAESYHSVFTISQTLTDIPNGTYGVTVQGFCRADEGSNVAEFFANETSVLMPDLTGAENSLTDASASFSEGKYTTEEFLVTVTDGTLKLGVRNTESNSLWCVWDNFNLTYYGGDVSGTDTGTPGLPTPTTAQSLRYWIDDDAASVTTASTINGTHTIDATSLGEGLHTIHFQVIDSEGRVGIPFSNVFVKLSGEIVSSQAKTFRYWFDDSDDVKSAAATSGIQTIDASDLSEGLHTVHYQLIDTDDNPSSVMSNVFVKISPQTVTTDAKTFRYWFDDSDDIKSAAATSGIQTIDASDLSEGLHTVHYQLIDTDDNPSFVMSNVFVKISPQTVTTDAKTFRYWFDDSDDVKSAAATSGIQTIDASDLSEGLHTVHYQLIDTDDNPSSVMSNVFVKFSPQTVTTDAKTFRYWFDDSDDIKSAAATSGIQTIDASDLSEGLHTVHYQLIDTDDNPSSVMSNVFVKFSNAIQTTTASSVRYWFDEDTIAKTEDIVGDTHLINARDLRAGTHTLHYQLIDSNGDLCIPMSGEFEKDFETPYDLVYMVDGEEFQKKTVICGDSVSPLAAPSKVGYTFYKWDGLPEDSIMPLRDVTANALYYLHGDVNADDKVNITDAVCLVNDRLGFESVGFIYEVSDVNRDKQYTIADAISVLNIMYGEPATANAAARRAKTQSETLSLCKRDARTLSLDMNIANDYSAFQLEIELPNGVELNGVSLKESRCPGFTVQYNRVGNSQWRLVVYNLANEPLLLGNDNLLNFSVTGSDELSEVKVTDIHFSTISATDVRFDDMTLSEATGIEIVSKSGSSSSDDKMYNTSGIQVGNDAKGIVIVNGEKIVKQ